MKKNSIKDYAVALYETTKGLKGHELEKAIKEFSALLFKEGMTSQKEKIISEFVRYFKKQEGIVEIEITSARELSEKTLEKITKNFGDKVEVKMNIDEKLIGGMKVKTDEMIFDASLLKQLQVLKQNLI